MRINEENRIENNTYRPRSTATGIVLLVRPFESNGYKGYVSIVECTQPYSQQYPFKHLYHHCVYDAEGKPDGSGHLLLGIAKEQG